MRGGFTKGLIIGSIIGASVRMIMDNRMSNRTRRNVIRNGRSFIRRSGSIIGDVVDMLR